VSEAVEKANAQKIMLFPRNIPVLDGSRISMEFDIFRYVLIFLTDFGHNLGTILQHGPAIAVVCSGVNRTLPIDAPFSHLGGTVQK
jgi:hypothetical protein